MYPSPPASIGHFAPDFGSCMLRQTQTPPFGGETVARCFTGLGGKGIPSGVWCKKKARVYLIFWGFKHHKREWGGGTYMYTY